MVCVYMDLLRADRVAVREFYTERLKEDAKRDRDQGYFI